MMTLTITPAATVFAPSHGEDTLYRYDLPAIGVTEGWAIPEILEQLEELGEELALPIQGDAAAVEVLTAAWEEREGSEASARAPGDSIMENRDDAAVAEDDGEVYGAAETGETPGLPPEIVRRPAESRRERRLRLRAAAKERALREREQQRAQLVRPLAVNALYLWLAVVLVLVLTVTWWAVSATMHDGAASVPAPAVLPAAPSPHEKPAPQSPPASSSMPVSASVRDTPPAVVLESQRLRMRAPAGFTVQEENRGILVVGPDPHLRIHVAADPTFGVETEAVYRQIHAMIADDPQLSPLPADAGSVAVRYREDPGDGSRVEWITWVTADHQLSVGCQGRHGLTVPQQAACRIVAESVAVK